MSHKQLVLGIFADEASAQEAVVALADTAVASGDAMGILVLDDKGRLKTDKVGARSWKAGAGVGACLLVVGPAALGVGIVGGTLAGGLHHKNLGMSDWEKEHLATDLKGGKAAVGVLADRGDGPAIAAAMANLGGLPESFELSEETLESVAAATQS